MQILAKKNWSPYVSGSIIGLLQIPLVLFLSKTLGASSSLSVVVYYAHALFFKDIFRSSMNDHVWQVGLIIGVILGARISACLSKTNRLPISTVWKREFGIQSKLMRYFMSFIGGVLLVFGARLANGCTSGNGISGTSQLDASSWVVLMSMFVFAILTAQLLRVFFIRKGR